MGGGHTFHVSLLYPNTFDYYGLFSAGLHLDNGTFEASFAKQIENSPTFAQQSAKLFGSKPKLYWMGMGKTDFLYQSTVDLRNYWRRLLKKKNGLTIMSAHFFFIPLHFEI